MKKTLSKAAVLCACCFPVAILAQTTEIEGISGTVDGKTATFRIRGDNASNSECGMRIDYGDGTAREYQVNRTSGMFPREFTKTYAQPGSYIVKVQGQNVNGYQPCAGSAMARATVGHTAVATTTPMTQPTYVERDQMVTTRKVTTTHNENKATKKATHKKTTAKRTTTAQNRHTPVHEPQPTIRVTRTPVYGYEQPMAMTTNYYSQPIATTTTSRPVGVTQRGVVATSTTLVTPQAYPSGQVPSSVCPRDWDLMNENPKTGAFTCQRTPLADEEDVNAFSCGYGLVFYRTQDTVGCRLPANR